MVENQWGEVDGDEMLPVNTVASSDDIGVARRGSVSVVDFGEGSTKVHKLSDGGTPMKLGGLGTVRQREARLRL